MLKPDIHNPTKIARTKQRSFISASSCSDSERRVNGRGRTVINAKTAPKRVVKFPKEKEILKKLSIFSSIVFPRVFASKCNRILSKIGKVISLPLFLFLL